VIVCWSEGDQAVIGEVPELPGYAADGQTQREAPADAKAARQAWLETAQQS
jgi:predicted RNase H-like HicB family nuclease